MSSFLGVPFPELVALLGEFPSRLGTNNEGQNDFSFRRSRGAHEGRTRKAPPNDWGKQLRPEKAGESCSMFPCSREYKSTRRTQKRNCHNDPLGLVSSWPECKKDTEDRREWGIHCILHENGVGGSRLYLKPRHFHNKMRRRGEGK